MSYRISIRREAEFDIHDAQQYYWNCLPGLDLEFLEALDLVFQRAADNPFQFPLVYKNLRRAIVPRFSHLVLFAIDEDVVRVYAVMHPRRDLMQHLN